MYRFTGFTQKANDALNNAITAAENLGHTYVGSEHILLGLLKESGGMAYTALSAKKISYGEVEAIIKNNMGIGSPTVLSPNDFTPRAKNIIDTAIMQGRGMGHSYIGTEHILMGIIREGTGAATEILASMGIQPQELLRDLTNALGSTSSPSGNHKNDTKEKSDTPTLSQFGRDLTVLATQGRIDPVIGRHKEIERVIQILSRRTKNNPCLIGEPGVGKTAIAEGLALKIATGEVPELLRNKRIITLDLTGMVAGTKYRGDFEERIRNAIDEVKKAGDIILFIDEVHTLIGAGSAEGAVDAANILKPSLARGELQVIGATTLEEYRKHIEKDSALERRFQPVTVGEPTEEEAVEILKGLRDKYEAHHKVRITDGAILAAVKMSSRYIGDRYLPDKAIDLVDEAASRVRLKAFTAPPDLKELEDKVKSLNEEMQSAVNSQDFEHAAALRDEKNKIAKELENERRIWKEKSSHSTGEVSEKEIADIVSQWTGIPVVQLTQEESQRLLHMEEELHQRIVGQDEAVSAVARAIRRGRAGLKDPKRPTGSFIFLGPTGVGKTELCKTLAASMFGDENAMIRLDMSEYMEKHTVSRLVGSPPGYVGYEEGGQLTEKVRRRPYSVVLFDEIEKAHPDVFNMLLQILEDGILTDSQGRRVDFKNCIIIMTSNVGAKKISQSGQGVLGFAADKSETADEKKIREAVMGELKNVFRPEFLNRVDDIIVFRQLKQDDINEIARRMLSGLSKRVKELDFELEFSDEAVEEIGKAGFDPVYGARPLRRAIQQKIEDKLSEEMLEGKLVAGNKYVCTVENGEYKFI
ncbi:MAG: ATP-dependent Clp protease ATP-binding subunit [Clostridia bacterium]|nr:ATP-dependent Clp protease ATP-binding subunit [Clostridia bacterium]MBR3817525.1 ATP-dependent Clp protease ATP-binding subunit [Clostridia bacterium]